MYENEALEVLRVAEKHMDDALEAFSKVLVGRCAGTEKLNDLFISRAKKSFDQLYEARDNLRRRY